MSRSQNKELTGLCLVRRSLTIAGMVTVAVLLVSFLAARLWVRSSPVSVARSAPWLQVFSGAFFLWSVLGLLGWEIQTIDGNTPPEKINRWVFRVLNGTGMLLLFTSSIGLLLVR